MKPSQSQVRASVLAPIAGATTARTAAIDTQGADYATIVVQLGAQLNTNAAAVALNLKEADTNASTSAVTFNSSCAVSVTNTAACVHTYAVDLKGRKRYLHVSITPDTTTNGTVLSAVVSSLTKETSGANSANADSIAVV